MLVEIPPRRYRSSQNYKYGEADGDGGSSCGRWCAPEWDKMQLDSKSLAVAPGLRAPVAVTLWSCIGDEPLYWQWAEDVFEVMNSETQTHNISGHSRRLLCWMKQIHLLSAQKQKLLFSRCVFHSNVRTVCTFKIWEKQACWKLCIEKAVVLFL